MTREEMWKEFEDQLIRETRTPITISFDTAERMTKLGIKETVYKWKDRLELALTQQRWIPCSERLPEDDKKQYIVQKTNGSIDILGFTKDAYKLDRYDFAEYKGKNKQLFYKYDSEYGYIEWKCEAWQPLPEPYKAES